MGDAKLNTRSGFNKNGVLYSLITLIRQICEWMWPFCSYICAFVHMRTQNWFKIIISFLRFLVFLHEGYMILDVQKHHCVRSVQIWSFFWSKYGKIRTRKISVLGHFSRNNICLFKLFEFTLCYYFYYYCQ